MRCLVCNNIGKTDTFTGVVTGESFKINHLCCNDKCFIYLLSCKYVRNNIHRKQLIDLDYNRRTIKKVIENS